MMIKHIIKIWIPFVFISTVLAGTILLAVQQNYRQSANDPQIYLAEDAAHYLSDGSTEISNYNNRLNVEISESLYPFVMIFDEKGKLIAGDALINGQAPVFYLPTGIFKWVANHGEDRVTWQPQSGVRIATVIVPFSSSKGS